MTEQINGTNFQDVLLEGLLDLSKGTGDDAGTGGNMQELSQDFNLADALDELSTIQKSEQLV